MSDRNVLLGIAAVAGIAAGVAIGWTIWGRAEPAPGGRAPEERQADGSLVLGREPAAKPEPAPHVIPRGGREERRVEATVQPSDQACPPVSLVLSLVRMPDGSARVVASSPDGRVTGGVDVPLPVRTPAFSASKPWAAGVSYAGDRAYGVFVHRDLWRFRLGIEVNAGTDGGAEARALVGWTW